MAIIQATIDLPLGPAAAFECAVEGLVSSLERRGIAFDAKPGGKVREGGRIIGRVTAWRLGARVTLEWRPGRWSRREVTQIDLRAARIRGGSRLTLAHRRWGRLIPDPADLAGWFGHEIAAPIVHATAPSAIGDWLTDRLARRPSGANARAVYRDPLYHYPNFAVILDELKLTGGDYLLEVGCGGGALLKKALASGCRAAAVDHSPDMVRLARLENADAVREGRLEVVEASADALPFPDDTFTCGIMTGVLGFLREPVRALAEMRRVLVRGGRIVVLGSDPELKGTPAAPEPIASRLRFYDDDELEALGREAGFHQVEVARRDLEQHARDAGVPEEHIPLFSGLPTRFLFARRA